MSRILIIKHGSLGDIVFALPVIHSINIHFAKRKEIDLLTDKKYLSFLKVSKYFNSVIEDNRSKNIFITLKLLFNLIRNKYDLVIDLQNSSRTSYYNLFFRLFSLSKISSSRKYAHFRYIIPVQGTETSTQGLFNQINLLNIKKISNIQYDWLQEKLSAKYNNKLVLLIPGVSKNGKYKQWDPKKFGELAQYCEKKNYQICIVGTNNDYESVLPILNNCKNIINCIDISPPSIIYSIAKKSTLIVTNDTGPGHIASLSGNKTLWIVNENKITASNIDVNPKNLKMSSYYLNDITSQQVINFINDNNLL